MQLNTNTISHKIFTEFSQIEYFTPKTTKAKFKKEKGNFPTILVVSDQEVLVRTREQTKNFFLLRSVISGLTAWKLSNSMIFKIPQSLSEKT